MKKLANKIKLNYNWGGRYLGNSYINSSRKINEIEVNKLPSRTELINFLLSKIGKKETNYLEIGVRNPDDNFNKINTKYKYSVDPGVEFEKNPVDFKMESDVFFERLRNGQVLNKDILFDVIFVDGLHLANQAYRDIINAYSFLNETGFIVVHDCNPPTEWHAREEYAFDLSPARNYWNGTTWKAFYKCRLDKQFSCACIDTDWGLGIITKKHLFKSLELDNNPFFEYKIFDNNRVSHLNLMNFDHFSNIITANY